MNLLMFKHLRVVSAIGLSFTVASQVMAIGGAGIGNEVLSARASGQGYVGVAGQNDDPAVVYVNPAALTNLPGTQVTAGFHWENLHGQYEDNSGNQTSMRSIDAAVPNMALTHSFMDGKLAAGLSIESPYGLETHWAGDSPLRYVATNSKLGMAVVSPGVAYQICPIASFGVAADYVNLFDAALEKHVSVDGLNFALRSPTSGSPDANSRLFGTAASWGYHTGLMIQPNKKNAVGITYHSKVKLNVNGSVELSGLSGASADLFGGSNYTTSAYTDLYLPQNIQLGYAFKPNDKWMLEADAAWYDWFSNQNLNVRYSETDQNRLKVLNTGNPTPLNWRDAWSVATGANYKATDKIQVRGGFWYEPWTEPESAFSPSVIDLSRYGISAGLGYALTQNLTLDAAYSAVFFHNRSITNGIGASSTGNPAYNINGVYKNFTNLVALNLTYRYGK